MKRNRHKEKDRYSRRYGYPIEYDEDNDDEDGIPYVYVEVLAIIALMLPQAVFIIYTSFINPAPNSAWLMLGFIGCFVFGMGIMNLVAKLGDSSFGIDCSLICFCIGVLAVLICFNRLYGWRLI